MPKHGTPEPPTVRFGHEIARLRVRRGWSRTALVRAAHDQLPRDHPLYQTISNDWLRYLEEGKRAHLTRPMVLALARLVTDTEVEYLGLVAIADRNICCADDGTLSATDLKLLGLLHRLSADPMLRPLLEELLSDEQFADVNAADLGAMLRTLAQAVERVRSLPGSAPTPTQTTSEKERP